MAVLPENVDRPGAIDEQDDSCAARQEMRVGILAADQADCTALEFLCVVLSGASVLVL